jgi:hypothetical protein
MDYADLRRRMQDPRVVALAGSTDDLGGEPMNAPTLNGDASPPRLVAGRDRMAATLLRKRKHVWVHVGVDWTPADLLKAEIHENLYRRHDDKAALTKALVDKAEGILDQTVENCAPRRGQPKSTRTQARELVAEASGESLIAVQRRDERAQVREEQAAGNRAAGASAAPPPAPIETFGHEIPAVVAAGIGSITSAFDKADQLLRQVQAALAELALTSFSPGLAQRLKMDAQALATRVRSERPYALCPYCIAALAPDRPQGEDGPKCGVCQEQRYVNRSTYEAAPGKRGAEPVASVAKQPARKKGMTVEYQGETMTLDEFERRAGGS